MSIQIALAWNEECEKELKRMGFRKQEVYLKQAPPGMTKESNSAGDREFFSMKAKPFQFVTTSYWGAGPE